jgi:pimeloyl-ACP methyl ester carboxylesterase
MNMDYIRFGDGPKHMVILPGISLKPVSTAAQAVIQAYDVFSKDFTVWLFDYREDPEEDLKIEDMADDVAQALKELDIRDIYLYGVSMGGMVAQSLCIRYPDLVRKLVLTSTVCKADSSDKPAKWLANAKAKDIFALVNDFMLDVYSKEVYEQLIDTTIAMYKSLSDEELRDFTIRLKAAEAFDSTDQLEAIRIPVLVLGSKEDQVFSYEEMRKIADILHCESYFYDGYSHAVYDEAPDIKQRIYDFFMK